MICKKCGRENALAKKYCAYCGSILEGYTINNFTGVYGYRGADGLFYNSQEEYLAKNDKPKVNAYEWYSRLSENDRERVDALLFLQYQAGYGRDGKIIWV